jgi:hypothetical protein
MASPPYPSLALHNLPNYAFLAGTVLATIGGWDRWGFFPLIAGLGVEVLWLTVGSGLPFVRRHFDREIERRRIEAEAKAQHVLLESVRPDERRRFNELGRLFADIERECASNPSLTMSLVKSELVKLDQLLTVFLRVANTAARYERLVESSDLNELEESVRRQEAALAHAQDDEARSLGKKNLEVLTKRVEKAKEVHGHIRSARGQLNLIENTFKLLRDQIVTMQSPNELAGQVEEVMSTIDSIEASGRETDRLMHRLDAEISALKP